MCEQQIGELLRRISELDIEFDPDTGGTPLADVWQSNSLGEQALHFTAWHLEPADIDLLLENGSLIDEPGERCMPPLGYALLRSRVSNAIRLLERGADPELLTRGVRAIKEALRCHSTQQSTRRLQPGLRCVMARAGDSLGLDQACRFFLAAPRRFQS